MDGELNRYFIELQPAEAADVPRYREAEIRREQASNFLERIEEWLRENELDAKVTAMAVTALGQVQITCQPDVISQIRSHNEPDIAMIRQSSMMMDSHRLNSAR